MKFITLPKDILIKNDGDIVNKILREENNHEKEYVVKVNRPITNYFVKKISPKIHDVCNQKIINVNEHQRILIY